jgi:hypothetical protein
MVGFEMVYPCFTVRNLMRPTFSRRIGVGLMLAIGLAVLHGCGSDDHSSSSAEAYPRDDALRLNQIQVVGSHNSYHIQARPELFQYLLRFGSIAQGIQYSHPPLDVQFETQGVRQIEIDVWADPQGDCVFGPTDIPLAGVQIDLLDDAGHIVTTTTTEPAIKPVSAAAIVTTPAPETPAGVASTAMTNAATRAVSASPTVAPSRAAAATPWTRSCSAHTSTSWAHQGSERPTWQ